jgi:hypothetical protein
MNAALRAHAILADPAAEWRKIEVEPSDAAHLLTSYVALLALIPAISGFIGACVVGSWCREVERCGHRFSMDFLARSSAM